MIPRSWAALHLSKLPKVPTPQTSLEMARYQQFLVQLITGLCELVTRIEQSSSLGPVQAKSLTRRSINIIAVSMVNMGTVSPLPPKYSMLWCQAQTVCDCPLFIRYSFNQVWKQVFRYTQLFANVPAARLPQNLRNSFSRFRGNDEIIAVVTGGYNEPLTYAGLQFHNSTVMEHTQKPAQCHHRLKKAQINAAYKYIFATQVRRECEELKHQQLKEEQLMFRQLKVQCFRESTVCRNCCVTAVETDYARRFTY